ncbi:nucleoporin nup211-like [Cryptotermes secundus]|uniref:nucleoporin nup211-like n=1 Tax=Cryptotermes secundus TaxID=105785 RepID=UPI001454BC35|nr:nucleoporin nup211-like [Cryptotermes secundus]
MKFHYHGKKQEEEDEQRREIREAMPGCRKRHAEASRSHREGEADDSDGSVDIFRTATNLDPFPPCIQTEYPKKTSVPAKMTGRLLTKVIRRDTELSVGEAETLRQQKDYISSTEAGIEVMKTDATPLEAQTNPDTSQSDTFRQDTEDPVFESAGLSHYTEVIKNEALPIQEQINIVTSHSNRFRRRDTETLILEEASIKDLIKYLKKDAAELEQQINMKTSQSNPLRQKREVLILQPACTAADVKFTKSNAAGLEERKILVTSPGDKVRQRRIDIKIQVSRSEVDTQVVTKDVEDPEINLENSQNHTLTRDRDALLLEGTCTTPDIEDMKEEAEELEELINFLRNWLTQNTDTLTVEADRSEPLIEVLKEAAELEERANLITSQRTTIRQETDGLTLATAYEAAYKQTAKNTAEIQKRINVITSQMMALRRDRDDLAFQAACTAGHIEHMKKASAALGQQINLLTLQSDNVRQERDALVAEAACMKTDIEAKKKDAGLQEQINLLTSESDKLRPERDDLILKAASAAGHIEFLMRGAAELEERINMLTSQSNRLTQDRDSLLLQTARTATLIEVKTKDATEIEQRICLVTAQSNTLRQERQALVLEAARTKGHLELVKRDAELEEQINLVTSQINTLRENIHTSTLQAACSTADTEVTKKDPAEMEERITHVNSQTNILREHRDEITLQPACTAADVKFTKSKSAELEERKSLVTSPGNKVRQCRNEIKIQVSRSEVDTQVVTKEGEELEINLENSQNHTLTQDSGGLEATCTTPDIEDMKKDAEELEERITQVNLQTDTLRENRDEFTLQPACTAADVKFTKSKSAELEERKSLVTSPGNKVRQCRNEIKIQVSRSEAGRQVVTKEGEELQINLENTQNHKLTRNRDALLLEARCTTPDIEDMKKDAEELEELIHFLRNSLKQDRHRSEPLTKVLKEAAELEERMKPTPSETKTLGEHKGTHALLPTCTPAEADDRRNAALSGRASKPGPLKASQMAGEPSCEGESNSETQDSYSEQVTTGGVVLFINEANLANSPQVEVQVLNKIKFTAILDSGSETGTRSSRTLTQCAISCAPMECVLASEAACISSPRSRVPASLNASPTYELEVNSVETALPHGQPIPNPKPSFPDPRSLQAADLHSLVEQVTDLSTAERSDLYQVLFRYREHMTTRPGKCKLFIYKFQVDTDRPIVGHSRPIPFALRPAVREQIRQMLVDDIIEYSNSPILNPLTVVSKEGGDIRICVDARRVNEVTIPDHERTPPMNELLQRFHGAKYFTSLDLSSTYSQVELHEDSRKYTAFTSESTVYQYKRVPYGFRNSLPAFVRAIKVTLGTDLENVVSYVEDILIHSPTIKDHLRHLDTVLDKLTKAGFTINAKKCRFCKDEVRFLGHRIDRTGVSADPDRVQSILNYPAPGNSKQLRQFLGTCNFHSRFIIGYANYVVPLTPLLKQGVKWTWTDEARDAFLRLRQSFARSIHLVHPRDDAPNAIYTDASKLGISSILNQESDSGETLVVSTASRVLSPVERRYFTCEQELLAVVYALQKFRIYVIGHSITVYSDNKALSFLKRCNLTSSRVTRWVMQLQEYELKIVHIKGSDNFFADMLSRNPIGLSQVSRDQVLKPKELFVAIVDLGTDRTHMKELGNLSEHQLGDPALNKLRGRTGERPREIFGQVHGKRQDPVLQK